VEDAVKDLKKDNGKDIKKDNGKKK